MNVKDSKQKKKTKKRVKVRKPKYRVKPIIYGTKLTGIRINYIVQIKNIFGWWQISETIDNKENAIEICDTLNEFHMNKKI